MKIDKLRTLPEKTHQIMVDEWMKDANFKAEYNALEEEFTLLDECLRARKRMHLTQDEVAKRMGTKAPAVARLESSLADRKHSPSLNTLRRYAAAMGCKLVIHFRPIRKSSARPRRKSR